MNKARELAELYYTELKWWTLKSSNVNRAEATFQEMIDNGTDPESIRTKITEYKLKHPTREELNSLTRPEAIFCEERATYKGLMRDGVFYYHPRLQIAPGPPKIHIEESGEIIRSNEPFFLELIDCFTMEDLVTYFYQKADITKGNLKRDERGFEYVFKQIDVNEPMNALDLILFTIDGAVALAYDKDEKAPKSAVELLKYIEEGYALYVEKYNNCKLMGLDHVTPRR